MNISKEGLFVIRNKITNQLDRLGTPGRYIEPSIGSFLSDAFYIPPVSSLAFSIHREHPTPVVGIHARWNNLIEWDRAISDPSLQKFYELFDDLTFSMHPCFDTSLILHDPSTALNYRQFLEHVTSWRTESPDATLLASIQYKGKNVLS